MLLGGDIPLSHIYILLFLNSLYPLREEPGDTVAELRFWITVVKCST